MSKRKPIILTWPSVIIVIILLSLMSYSVVDVTVQKPKINEKVEYVTEEFDSLKIYLDEKIPYLQESVDRHEEQLKDQEEQLKRINELTETLKADTIRE